MLMLQLNNLSPSRPRSTHDFSSQPNRFAEDNRGKQMNKPLREIA